MAKMMVNDDVEFRKRFREEGADWMRHLVKETVQSLMSADADARCGAGYGERSDERSNSRNGYRSRAWDCQAGSIDLQVPKLRSGSYFPHWLLEPRRRVDRALHQVVAECYVTGVSTRRVDKLVQTLGIDGIDKSQVSRIAKDLDVKVEEFRNRPLTGSPYRYVWIDALYIKAREGGRTVSVAVGIASAVNHDGKREIIGVDTFTSETGAAWTAFLRSLVARGLHGVQLVISDCHEGLKGAIAACLPGASWQRCRTHFMRNLLSHAPKKSHDFVATLVRSIFAQNDPDAAKSQFEAVVTQLERACLQKAAHVLAEARDDLLAYTAFPTQHWKQIWSNNPQERLNKEIRRRTDVVGIFPDRDAIVRLVGAVLAEQNDEWEVSRCYMTFNHEITRQLDTRLASAQSARSGKKR